VLYANDETNFAEDELHAAIDEMQAEIERLMGHLQKANEQAEHFERLWYLATGEIENLKKEHKAQSNLPPDQNDIDDIFDESEEEEPRKFEVVQRFLSKAKAAFLKKNGPAQ
jgi:hypothetical protein